MWVFLTYFTCWNSSRDYLELPDTYNMMHFKNNFKMVYEILQHAKYSKSLVKYFCIRTFVELRIAVSMFVIWKPSLTFLL
jgi:hypothetical protein